jgi:hypothetical protein
MKDLNSMDVRPYQLLCLICRQGRVGQAEPYYFEERLEKIYRAVKDNPVIPLTLRCNTDTVFKFQNPGRDLDTPEGARYNDLRDLTILQRLGKTPAVTMPAVDLFEHIIEAIPDNKNICWYPHEEAPAWPECKFAHTGNYQRGIAAEPGNLVYRRKPERKRADKQNSVNIIYNAKMLRIRPHHLLCMACFYGNSFEKSFAPIEQDNLFECMKVMQKNPDMPVQLIHGPCMICPPCRQYYPDFNLCIGGKSMGLRDDKKDLDTLRKLGLDYGDILPANQLYAKIYKSIKSTTEICGNIDGIERGREWRICGGPGGNNGYIKARNAGFGILNTDLAAE